MAMMIVRGKHAHIVFQSEYGGSESEYFSQGEYIFLRVNIFSQGEYGGSKSESPIPLITLMLILRGEIAYIFLRVNIFFSG